MRLTSQRLPLGVKQRYIFVITMFSLAVRRVIAIPAFQETSYETHSEENTPVDTLITELQAFDTQGGDPSQISYSIEDNPWFKINATGFVKVKSIINAEDSAVQNVMTYIVTANNPSGSGTTTLSVIIDDSNEFPPTWGKRFYATDIFEGDIPGTSIVNLTARDRDRDDNVTFNFHPDFTLDFPYFDINAFTGEVTVNKTIDMADIIARQNGNPFFLRPRIYDGRYYVTGLVRVTARDKNHFPPEFIETQINVTVSEGQSGVTLGTFSATDNKEDPVQQIRFRIPNQVVPGSLSIGQSSGEVTLISGLDREAIPGGVIRQLVTAEDDGTPLPVLTNTATLIITVTDINDNIPRYAVPTHDLILSQTYNSGETFNLPLATDLDEGENARVVYGLSPEAEQYFTIDPATSVITTKSDCGPACIRTVDCSWMSIRVYAFNDGTPLLNDTLTVNITLTAPSSSGTPSANLISCSEATLPNDFDPTFTRPRYDALVSESSPIDETVLLVRADDDDFGTSGEVVYSINSPTLGVTENGEIFLKRELDYETPSDRYVCANVVATDKGTPPRSSTAEVCINVTNANDNQPNFPQTTYDASIPDGSPALTPVVTITATDLDGPENLTYEFTAPVTYLSIDSTTGEIKVSDRIIKSNIIGTSAGDSVQITVRVRNGRFSAETTLNITIESSNKFDPSFSQPLVDMTIPEGTTGVFVTLQATDNDVPQQSVSYQLADPALNGVFAVSDQTGELQIVSAIDRENLPQLLSSGTVSVLILAIDDGFPVQRTGTATVNVQIGDINDNVPQFSQTEFETNVYEDFAPGMLIQLPDASDLDIGENARINYNISSDVLPYFTAQGNSITTSVTCDNSCVKSTDCELLKLSLWAFNPDRPLLRSELRVTVNLLKLGSTRPSAGTSPALQACDVAPTPNDNDPQFSEPNPTVTVFENIPSDTVILVLNVTDDDFGESGQVTFIVTNSTDFTINDNGEISNTRILDYEDPNDRTICFQVQATDKGTPARSSSTVVCVNVENYNEHSPRFSRRFYNASVYDQETPGTFVISISASDDDDGFVLNYDFIQPNEYFQIASDTGNVTVQKTINRADILINDPSGVVNIQTRVGDGKFVTTVPLRITILETNKFSPEFNQTVYFAQVDEEVSGVNVIQITANDGDVPRQEITYQLISSTLPNDIFSVNPSTGQIQLDQRLDRDTMTSGVVELVLEARDSGNPPPQRSSTATIRVTINDVNDNTPVFNPDSYRLQIFQNFTSGSSFILPKATDQDVTDVVRYSISDNAKEFFSIDENTGTVTTRNDCTGSCVKLVDCNYMNFMVWAFNPSAPNDRATLNVNLTLLTLQGQRSSGQDLPSCSQASTPNDNDPQFSEPNPTVTVMENIPSDTVILVVNVTDDDFGESGQVTFTVTNSTDFTINDNGEISNTRILDYEDPNDRTICFQVQATDKGTPARSSSTVVCVNVENYNEHSPRFSRRFYNASVYDEETPGTFVISISASDDDDGFVLNYDFIQPNEYFQIASDTGNVTVQKTINRADILINDPSGVVNIQTRVGDGKFVTTVPLRITILETNKFSPEFNQTVYFAQVDEEVSGVNVIQITANDGDVPRQEITYQLISSTLPNDIFSVNPSTGQIQLDQRLDRDTMTSGVVELVLEARDSGNPPPQRSSTATIRVTINDVNDNTPVFNPDSYRLQIFQNFTSGSSFILPKATDQDVTDVVRYSISDNAKEFFSIDENTGTVTTRNDCTGSCVKLVDCNYMNFMVWAFNPSAPNDRATLNVNLTLLTLQGQRSSGQDLPSCSQASTPNDNDPQFSEPNPTVTVMENIPSDTVILVLNVTDDDFGESGQVTFTVTNSTDFTINDNGEISNTRILDYEDPNDRTICFQVQATDKGTPARSSSTVVCVNVENYNEHSPRFSRRFYNASVYDEETPGTFVISISASDNDDGFVLNYDFIQPNEYFQIASDSGNVTVQKTINRADILIADPSGLVNIQARVSDGKFSTTVPLRISILETNKFPPEFNPTVYDARVDEEVSNIDVIQSTAQDRDIPAQPISYRLINSSLQQNAFSVNPTTGMIRLDEAIDREAIRSEVVLLFVEATDSGSPPPQRTGTATIRVIINDLNDNNPLFDRDFYDLKIYQNFSAGEIFSLPKATDADPSDVVRYELSNNAQNFFTVDETSGNVQTKSDCGSSCVKLTDCHYMTFLLWAFNPSDNTMRDSLRVNLTLLTLQGTPASGTDIPVCSDALTPNENDPKFSEPNPVVNIPEGTPPGRVILVVNTTDDDFGNSGSVVYIITNSTDFQINEKGEISPTRDLDYENVDDRIICVEVVATDKGTPPRSASTAVCVVVENVNEHPPKFVSDLFFAFVTDGDPVNTLVMQMSATDDDAQTSLTYRIASPNEYFIIDPSYGNITVAKTIDRKDALGSSTNNYVSLSIRVSDGSRESGAELRVTIAANNFFAPVFEKVLFEVSIPEESLTNPVTRVTATDEDRVDEDITYSIFNSTLQGVFAIDPTTGEVSMNKVIDREALSSRFVDIVVVATDSGRPAPKRSSSATVRVEVTDINDNDPAFDVTVYTINMYQNFSAGDVIMIPTASDPDENDRIVYSISPTDPWFEVDPDTGILRLRKDCGVDCVKIDDCFYGQLTVTASNPSSPNRVATLVLNINLLTTESGGSSSPPSAGGLISCSQAKPPNKNDPQFNQTNYEADLPENSPKDEIVLVVTATDDDWGDSGTVTYTITNSTDYGINDKGEIYVINPPDYEDPSRRRDCFEVVARDKGTPSRFAATVVCVNILNLNDNDPKFAKTEYEASVQDGDEPPTFVIQMNATDADPGTQLIYDFEINSPFFQIDPSTGRITVATTIDKAQIMATRGTPVVPLRVRVSDSGKVATTVLLVRITSGNEHAPKFGRDRYDAAVDEESTSFSFIQVQASDDDLPKKPVTYFIQTNNVSDYFAINPASGEISLIKTFNRESMETETVQITVVAVDSGDPSPQLSATTTVQIRINDINDNPPQFTQDSYIIRLPQNFSAGISRQLPIAVDADVGSNAQISYQLSQGAATYFDLDSRSAILKTIRRCIQCDRDVEYDWQVIVVTAFNRDKPEVTSELQVVVRLYNMGNYSQTGPIVAPVLYSESVIVNKATAKPNDAVFSLQTLIGDSLMNYTLLADNTTKTFFDIRPDGTVILKAIPESDQKTYTMQLNALEFGEGSQNITLNLLVNFVDDSYLDEKGIAAIAAICAIALLIIILAIVHIIWWKTRHKKDKDQVIQDEATTGCCCGKPMVAIQFTGESSL